MPSGAKRRKDGGLRLGMGARNGKCTPEIEIVVAQALAGDVVDCPAFDAAWSLIRGGRENGDLASFAVALPGEGKVTVADMYTKLMRTVVT